MIAQFYVTWLIIINLPSDTEDASHKTHNNINVQIEQIIASANLAKTTTI